MSHEQQLTWLGKTVAAMVQDSANHAEFINNLITCIDRLEARVGW